MKNTKKKGFTLAELLIVVAIVAILAAIAIPLLIGATTKAEKAVADANIRSVRSLGVVKILTDESVPAAGSKGWVVTATVGKDGAVSDIDIQADSTGGESIADTDTAVEGYQVKVFISKEDTGVGL